MRLAVGLVGLVISTFLALPPVHAADEDATAEAAQVESPDTHDVTREQILQEIDATRETDPELAAEMERQFQQWESGELDLTAERQVAFEGSTANAGQGTPELIGPPVDGGTTGTMPSYMTPELRDQLFQVYDGVANGQVSEQEARAKAEEIMREHGIDSREMGRGYEGTEQEHREAFERAMEQMSPEAREQMEKFFEGREVEYREMGQGVEGHEMERGEFETMQREYELAAPEAPQREFEGATREYEAATREYEAATHEYEAPTREFEALTHEYEAPTREFEAAVREYEAPQHEYEGTPQPY